MGHNSTVISGKLLNFLGILNTKNKLDNFRWSGIDLHHDFARKQMDSNDLGLFYLSLNLTV